MHGNLLAREVAAINVADRTGATIGPNGHQQPDQTDSDDERWFVALVKQLLSKDAGFVLHLQTGFEERTCYRYASGERKPSAYFVRTLLRSEQGWQWLSGIMEGSEPEWWRETKRARAINDAISRVPE